MSLKGTGPHTYAPLKRNFNWTLLLMTLHRLRKPKIMQHTLVNPTPVLDTKASLHVKIHIRSFMGYGRGSQSYKYEEKKE